MRKFIWVAVMAAIAAFVPMRGVLADEGAPASSDKTLKEISEKQDRILATLGEIQAELNVVKIRVSSQ